MRNNIIYIIISMARTIGNVSTLRLKLRNYTHVFTALSHYAFDSKTVSTLSALGGAL